MDDEIGGYLRPLEQWHYMLLEHWLIPVQYLWEEPLLCSTRNPESAQWFLDSVPYQKWIHADACSAPGHHLRENLTLVCSGPEGVGKTFLASAVVHDLYHRFRSDTTSDVGIAYVFCSASFHETQDPSNLLLALLQQLLSPFPAKNESSSWDLHSSTCSEADVPSPAEIGEALTAAIMAYKRVFFVVDGLDECPSQQRESLLQELFKLQDNHAVRLLATTTAEPEINSLFVHDSHMSIPYPAANAMRSFVGGQIRNAPLGFLKIEPKLEETVTDAVVNASNGSLMLAQLQLQILLAGPCLSSLEAALLAMRTGSYLQGFDGVYDVMVQRIQCLQPEKSALARRALSLVACARRPLTVEEFYIALTMEISEPLLYSSAISYIDNVLDACSGLLRAVGTVSDSQISDSDKHSRFISSVEKENLNARLHLVHHTAYDYLQRTSKQLVLDGEKHMTQVCLRYLSMPHFEDGICQTVEELRKRLRTYPLYNYAALHWGHHACAALFDFHEIESGLFLFFESPEHIESACQVLVLKSEFLRDQAVWLFPKDLPRRVYWLHLAGHFGILGLLCNRSINDKKFGHATNPKDSTGTRVLGYAVREGNIEAASIILQSTAVDVDSRDYKKRTPLMLAAMNGHVAVIELLLSRGADPNSKDEGHRTPLLYAAEQGHTAVVRLLLSSQCKTGVDVNVLQDPNCEASDCHTPLSAAASKGYDAIVCLLLAHPNINPNTGAMLFCEDLPPRIMSKRYLYTPLWLALSNGHCSVAAMLLDRSDVDINFAPSRSQITEVKTRPEPGLATLGYHEDTALKSSDRGNVDSTLLEPRETPTFDSILYVAVRHGDETLVERILDKVADAGIHNLAWGTPLHHAIQMGHETVVTLLLPRLGTSVLGIPDSTGYTPEEVAVSLGRVRIMRLLLIAGADPQIRNRNGRTLLAFAANLGEEGMVALLLESEAVDVNSQDNYGRTPLSLALSPCQDELGDVGHRWRQFRKKARPSTETGRLGVIRRLLETGRVDINCQDYKGRRPLSDAAWNGSLQALNMLLEKAETRLRLDDRDSEGHTALHLATKGGKEICAMRLLEEGAELDNLLLSIAAAAGQVAVVGALIARGGFDLGFRDEHDRTSLCWAAMKGHVAVVEQLLATRSVDVMVRDKDGKTPLHHAAGSEGFRLLPSSEPGVILQKGLLRSVEVLLSSNDIEPNIKDNTGRTPLSLAAQWSAEIVQRLLENDRVDPNVEDQQGWTPLFWAVYADRWDIINALLDTALRKTVNIHHKDKQGHTPLSLTLLYRNMSSERLSYKRMSSVSRLQMAVARSILSGRRNEANLTPAIDKLAEAEYAKLLPQELAPTFLDPNPDWFHSGSGHDRPKASHYPGWDSARDRFIHLSDQNESDEESRLCARCSELDLDAVFSLIPERGETVAPSIELVHIMPLTTPQCAMCRLLHQLSADWEVEVNDEHRPKLTCNLSTTSACGWVVEACYDAGSDLMKWGWVDAVFLEYPQSDGRGFIARVGSNDPGGMHSVTVHGLGEDVDFTQARRWLMACTEHHGSQCRLRVSRPIPHFRLVNCETKIIQQIPSDGPVPPFVALSYVWGPQHQDNSENVVDDAIIATRLLGYQFLWVDRHCVDQNQQTDQTIKSQQILAMDAIYQSAEVTIIAAAGKDSTFGLPGVPGGSRPRLRNRRTRARVKGHVLTVVPPEPICDTKNSAWWTRAWTLQEGLLSRRRLVFTEREVFFECQGMISREAVELPLQVHRWAARWTPVHENKRLWSRTHQFTSPQLKLIYLWQLIAEFGHRQLSNQSDALNAFLGILQSFSETRETRFPIFHLCGIPFLSQPCNGQSRAESFVSGLCWFPVGETRFRVRRQGFPSWSWTSCEGSVEWSYKTHLYRSCIQYRYAEGAAIDINIVDQQNADWTLSWLDFEFLAMDKRTSLPQNCQLRLTASFVEVTMQNQPLNRFNDVWDALIHIGDDVMAGSLYPDYHLEPDSEPFKRLAKDSWLAIVLGKCSFGLGTNVQVHFLLLEEVDDCWKRFGLIVADQIGLDFRSCIRKEVLLW